MTSLTPQLPAPLSRLWEWQIHARCKNLDADIFFPPDGEGKGARIRRERIAKDICSACPVQRECRDHAIAVREPFGVWGGISETDRRGLTDESTRVMPAQRSVEGPSLRGRGTGSRARPTSKQDASSSCRSAS
ncbi:WhiB family transcriptional regulator [Rhodococcus opacus]|uniref:WhiB family transcriptional regulator n=1 Tax=Rhodococcus opacus TaxID=37919 RepID=UPI002948E6A0|nr:WhiB family transcriptional regulator [Rhodococcus opacus]MDV6244882.1 WhiB family transcriptional regulator [Rhodococcus opacus]